MLDEFVKQAKRLFSSKSNGGKQVPQLNDQLHTLKQVLLGVALVLMIGYSQFRDHFKCQELQGLKADVVTNMCLVNGTTTVQKKEHASGGRGQPVPHVGHEFMIDQEDSRVVSHIYTRDLWLVLILLVACSFVAQRSWARLFQNEVLQALLQLAGSESGRLAKAAELAAPYKMLTSKPDQEPAHEVVVQLEEVPASERVTKAIEFGDMYVNFYDHKLDYFPNQLIYLLLTQSAASYKMSSLNLRRRLFLNSLLSSLFTMAQFLIPLGFIGPEYWTYGWRWLQAAWAYVVRVFWRSLDRSQGDWDANSIDYELSSSIFPVSVQCEIKVYGNDGSLEPQTTFCTAGINEICAKVFPFVWWFVVLNTLVELETFGFHSITWFGAKATETIFGRRYWPGARKEANLIATFRHRRAKLQARQEQLDKQRRRPTTGQPNGRMALSRVQLDLNNNHKQAKPEGAHERKRLEAGEDLEAGGAGRRRRTSQGWSRRVLCLATSSWWLPGLSRHTEWRRRRLMREPQRDINIYHLLYLLHLRLGKSRSRSEEVIKMTAGALVNYLAELEKSLAEARRQWLQECGRNGDDKEASDSEYKSDLGESEALNGAPE